LDHPGLRGRKEVVYRKNISGTEVDRPGRGACYPLHVATAAPERRTVRNVVTVQLEPVLAAKPRSALLPAGDDGDPTPLLQETSLASAGATHGGISDPVLADLGGSPLDNALWNDLAMAIY
jgi:hypothetical protein